MSSKEFKEIIAMVLSMDSKNRDDLSKMLKCKHVDVDAIEFLQHLASNSSDLSVAAVALKALIS